MEAALLARAERGFVCVSVTPGHKKAETCSPACHLTCFVRDQRVGGQAVARPNLKVRRRHGRQASLVFQAVRNASSAPQRSAAAANSLKAKLVSCTASQVRVHDAEAATRSANERYLEVGPGGGQWAAPELVLILLEQQGSHLLQQHLRAAKGSGRQKHVPFKTPARPHRAPRHSVMAGLKHPTHPEAKLSASGAGCPTGRTNHCGTGRSLRDQTNPVELHQPPPAHPPCCRPQRSGRCRGRCAAHPAGSPPRTRARRSTRGRCCGTEGGAARAATKQGISTEHIRRRRQQDTIATAAPHRSSTAAAGAHDSAELT